MKVKLKEEKEEEKDELNLPIEILFQIFEYLDLGDFIALSSVSKRYRALTNLFWRKLCINFKFSNGENRFKRSESSICLPWKETFIENKKWESRKFTSTIIKKTKRSCVSKTRFLDSQLYHSHGKELYQFSLSNLSQKKLIGKHLDDIRDFVIYDNSLVITSTLSKQLCLWETSHPQNSISTNSIPEKITKLEVIQDKTTLLCGTGDGKIYSWNLQQQFQQQQYQQQQYNQYHNQHNNQQSQKQNKPILVKEFSSSILLMSCRDEKVAVGLFRKNPITVYDVNTGKTIQELEGHSESVYETRFGMYSNLLSSVSYDGSTMIWDLRMNNNNNKGPIMEFEDGNGYPVFSIMFDGIWKVGVGTAYHSTMRLFDLRTKKYRTLFLETGTSSSPIYSLDMDDTRLSAATGTSLILLSL